MYVERAGVMRMLLSEEEQAAGRVRCFSLNEGALFVQASTHTDISKRVTAFQYELIRGERATAGETLSTTGTLFFLKLYFVHLVIVIAGLLLV